MSALLHVVQVFVPPPAPVTVAVAASLQPPVQVPTASLSVVESVVPVVPTVVEAAPPAPPAPCATNTTLPPHAPTMTANDSPRVISVAALVIAKTFNSLRR
jgi:hypothetical protein